MTAKIEKFIDFLPKIIPLTALFTLIGSLTLFSYQFHIKIFPYFINNYNLTVVLFTGFASTIIFSLFLILNALSCLWIRNLIFFLSRRRKFGGDILNKKFINAFSFLLFLIIFLPLFYHRSDYPIFSYFFTAGFFLCSIISDINFKNPGMQKMIFAFLLILAPLSILPVSAGTLPRVFVRFLGFHTSNSDQVFINDKIIPNIDERLRLYGQKSKLDCSVDMDGKTFYRLAIEESNLPLVVLWNDGSDKRVIGFDKSLIEKKEAYFPAMFVNANDVRELSSEGLICKK
ncbi:hypothetical protein [Zymomonas mobilis]|nr:hypothetical protein [Zymomonas mobilis]UBQ07419.1 hypothetical protein LB319_07310 [Zymomonas mobilis]